MNMKNKGFTPLEFLKDSIGVKKNNQKTLTGFTLIELLVVIAIIGLLATIVMVSLNTARGKARDSNRKASLKQMSTALEMYYNDNNAYPSNSGSWWGECDSYGSHPLSGASGYIPNLAPTYMSQLPLDPKGHNANGAGCCYLYNSNATDYKLLAHCTPETGYSTSDAFYDPTRPTWAWQVASPGGRSW